MDPKRILKESAYRNIPLSYDDARDLGRYALRGCDGDTLAQIQSVAMLSALHTKATYGWRKNGSAVYRDLPESAAEQIAGVCAAIFEFDIAKSEFGYLEPNVPYAMDNCGMGGDLLVTANVSTLAALIAAAAGIPMCKHGSPANADGGRHGSSDFIDLLGIERYQHKRAVEIGIEEQKFGYVEALDTRYKRIHLQTHEFAHLPHMNDLIGPITSPLHPKILTRRVLGVNHLVSPRVVAEAYLILNKKGITNLEHGFFVRGFGNDRESGMDEVSICSGGTDVAELRGGVISEFHLGAEDFGISPVPSAMISPSRGMSKGEFSLRILKGEIEGPPLQMVLANAALLFKLADLSHDLDTCYREAEKVQKQGLALAKVEALREGLAL